jgi:hypothetical protein
LLTIFCDWFCAAVLGTLEEHMALLQGMQSQMQGQAKTVEHFVVSVAHWLKTLGKEGIVCSPLLMPPLDPD